MRGTLTTRLLLLLMLAGPCDAKRENRSGQFGPIVINDHNLVPARSRVNGNKQKFPERRARKRRREKNKERERETAKERYVKKERGRNEREKDKKERVVVHGLLL